MATSLGRVDDGSQSQTSPATAGEQVVVGVAVLRAGRLLAARRTWPTEAAGRWELPGGKVEPGETLDAAAVREVAEELGCEIAVEEWLPYAVPIRPGLVLRVVTASLLAGEPVPTEHDQLRWLGAADLHSVDWLEPDRPFLADLAARLN